MTDQDIVNTDIPPGGLKYRRLTPEQIEQIEEMLCEIGEYGELHIIVQRGELRYINKVESRKFRDRDGDSRRVS